MADIFTARFDAANGTAPYPAEGWSGYTHSGTGTQLCESAAKKDGSAGLQIVGSSPSTSAFDLYYNYAPGGSSDLAVGFWFKPQAGDAFDYIDVVKIKNSGTAVLGALTLENDDPDWSIFLSIYDTGGHTAASNVAVLTQDTWYWISAAWRWNATKKVLQSILSVTPAGGSTTTYIIELAVTFTAPAYASVHLSQDAQTNLNCCIDTYTIKTQSLPILPPIPPRSWIA